jgi:hypothetical protein
MCKRVLKCSKLQNRCPKEDGCNSGVNAIFGTERRFSLVHLFLILGDKKLVKRISDNIKG